MNSRNNMNSIKETLEEQLKQDATILIEAAAIFGFAAIAANGEPLNIVSGLALISKTAGSAISAGLTLCNKFFNNSEQTQKFTPPAYDRFRVLLYISSLRCYIEAIPKAIKSFSSTDDKTKPTQKICS